MLKKGLLLLLTSLFLPIVGYGQGMPAPLVETVIIKPMTVKPNIKAVGTFKAESGLVLRSEIAGKITEVFFKSGDKVKKGQKLVQLNPNILEAQLHLYEADLKLSQVEYERSKELRKKNLTSKADFDKATAKLNVNQARVDEAKARLEQTVIRASFAGRVGLKQIHIGDYIKPGDPFVDLEDNDPILVDFNIPEVFISKISRDQLVSVRSDASPEKVYNGKIIASDIVANPQTRSITVRARLANPNWELIPGTFAGIIIHLKPQTGLIEVPQIALKFSAKENFVYRVVDGKAKKTPVELGFMSARTAVITKGLKIGDEVITIGIDKIQDGVPVRVFSAAIPKKTK